MLIDDEPLALAELSSMLKKYPDLEVVEAISDPETAIARIKDLRPQLIFLDINMPGKSGFDLLKELDFVPSVIFVTAYDQFAIKAFEVNALDYILKPINSIRLEEAVEKAKKQIANYKSIDDKLNIDKRIFIKDGEQCFFVPLAEVFLIESIGNYARVYYQNKKPLIHRSLNYLEERLPDTHFFRSGRQHIINVHYIKNIAPFFNNTLQVEMLNGEKVEISQRQSVKFKELMGI
jgi:two-component system LytT family response regulator